MLKKILIGFGAASVVLALVIATRPATFRIERSITMSAPPEAAFAQVNDLRRWVAWSPWEQRDPRLSRSYEGPATGVGAKYAWAGNSDVGSGRMTIEKSTPAAQVSLKLEFLTPFEATNTATFTFTSTPQGNRTTWVMEGRNTLVGKAMSLFLDMDQMLGPDFEQGLAALKKVAEATPQAPVAARP